MASGVLRWWLAMCGFWVAATVQAHAQSPAPAIRPGSTSEYTAASALVGPEQNARRLALMFAACQKQDAAGCYQLAYDLAYVDPDLLKAVPGMPSGANRLQFADQAVRLIRLWCAPERGVEEGCDVYATFLSNLDGSVARDLVLEGGRVLAKLCFAGKRLPLDCFDTEKWLAAAPAERSALATWVDAQFESACSGGDSKVCGRGFFRQYGRNLDDDLWQRLLRLVEASRKGCVAGSPFICATAGDFLVQKAGSANYPLAAEFFGAACKLPPRADEDDVREPACHNERLLRAEIAKAKPKP